MADPRSGVQPPATIGLGTSSGLAGSTHALDEITPDIRDAMSGNEGAPSSSNPFVTVEGLSSAIDEIPQPLNLGSKHLPFSFSSIRARKLARLHIGHTGVKRPGLPF